MLLLFFSLAEGEGFKPPIPERGIPDFESSAIDHSANLPYLTRTNKMAHLTNNSKGQNVSTLLEIACKGNTFLLNDQKKWKKKFYYQQF